MVNVGQVEIREEFEKTRYSYVAAVFFGHIPISALFGHTEKSTESDTVQKLIDNENVMIVAARHVFREQISDFYRSAVVAGEHAVQNRGDILILFDAYAAVNFAEREFAYRRKSARNEFVAERGRTYERVDESAEFKVGNEIQSKGLARFNLVLLPDFFEHTGKNSAHGKVGYRAYYNGKLGVLVFCEKGTQAVFPKFFALIVV